MGGVAYAAGNESHVHGVNGSHAGAAGLAAAFVLSLLSAGYVGKLVTDAVKTADENESE